MLTQKRKEIKRHKLMTFKSIFLLFSCEFPLPLCMEISWKDIKHYRTPKMTKNLQDACGGWPPMYLSVQLGNICSGCCQILAFCCFAACDGCTDPPISLSTCLSKQTHNVNRSSPLFGPLAVAYICRTMFPKGLYTSPAESLCTLMFNLSARICWPLNITQIYTTLLLSK